MNGFHLRALAVVAALTLLGGATAASAAPPKRGVSRPAKARSVQNVGPIEQLRQQLERLRQEAEERARRLRDEVARRVREELLRQQEIARMQREEAARKLQEQLARQREEAARKQELARKRRGGKRKRGSEGGPVAGNPVAGQSVGVEAGSGAVTVLLPGSNQPVPLEEAGAVPVGTVVDATKGSVTITPASQGRQDHATFSGGAFQVLQGASGRLTDIKLTGGDFGSCGPAPAPAFGRLAAPLAVASARRKPVRKIWAHGKGRFRTRGRNGSATVRGTVWMTADTCDGTLVKVKRGVVDVRDFAKRRTVAVRRGGKYLARGR